MKTVAVLGAALLTCVCFGQESRTSPTYPLLNEMRAGAPDVLNPSAGAWSPDAKRFAYTGPKGDLIGIEAATGKSSILLPKARINALTPGKLLALQRDYPAAHDTAREWRWAPDSRHMLFDEDGALWWVDTQSNESLHLVDAGTARGSDARVSPDGTKVSFLRQGNLFTVPVRGGEAVALTHTTDRAILNGEMDWVYEEELGTFGQEGDIESLSNYAWSPDARRVAYVQMDESEVPVYPLTDWSPRHAVTEDQRFPQPGDPNPAVRVGVVNAVGGETQWITLPISKNNDYIPRMGWIDSGTVWIEVLRRDQKKRDFFVADPSTGEAHLVASDEDPKYLPDNYDVQVLSGGRFAILSWRDGHLHIYLYKLEREGGGLPARAALEGELEHGDYDVSSFRFVEGQGGTEVAGSRPRVLFMSNEGEPIGRRLWSLDANGSKHLLTPAEGTHITRVSPDGVSFVDRHSAYTRPPEVDLCLSQQETSCKQLERFTPPADLRRPKLHPFTTRAADGTVLYSLLTLPDGAAPHSIPLLVTPYGGPADMTVRDQWIANAGVFVPRGFAVLVTDNRGMGGRGRAFEQACYHSFGPVQLQDQIAVLDAALKQYPQLDPGRLGWSGFSWGGTFAIYALTHSDRFRAGVEGSGVTDWHLYDSIYTERYLGLPGDNKAVYDRDSVVHQAANIKGSLLILQGTADDNVHLQNTMQWIEALNRAGKQYELELEPGSTHRRFDPAATEHLMERVIAFFELNLKQPPADEKR